MLGEAALAEGCEDMLAEERFGRAPAGVDARERLQARDRRAAVVALVEHRVEFQRPAQREQKDPVVIGGLGRSRDRAGGGHHVRELRRPLEGLAGAHRPAGDEAQPVDAELLPHQDMLQADIVEIGDVREGAPIGRGGSVARRGGDAVAEQVGQDDEVFARIEGAMLADHEGLGVCVGAGVPAWHQHGIVARGVQLAERAIAEPHQRQEAALAEHHIRNLKKLRLAHSPLP